MLHSRFVKAIAFCDRCWSLSDQVFSVAAIAAEKAVVSIFAKFGPITSTPADENSRLRQACAEAKTLLDGAAKDLRKILDDEPIIQETPIEASTTMELTAKAIAEARRILSMVNRSEKPSATLPGGNSGREGQTRQQGQFLAFIREYMMRNRAGQAPSHADLQRFFNLTPPSVNSMLIRLEQRGFIRREPGKARAIEIVIDPELIPPLEGILKF